MWYVSATALRDFTAAIFATLGLPPDQAAVVSDCLVQANLRGLDSHGVARIPIYAKRLRLGLVNPRPTLACTRVAQSAVHLDGDDGMGMVVGTRAMTEAIALAREVGIGMVGVRRSTHYGMAAYYVLQAVAADCIGFAFTNSSPGMAPFGGTKPILGVNPLAVGVPAGRRPAYVLDMAMSVVSGGKVRLEAVKGTKIPLGWILDEQGRPTDNPADMFPNGTLLPMGYKGFGMAIMIEILSGVLTRAGRGFKSLRSLHGFRVAPCLLARRAVVTPPPVDEVVMPVPAFGIDGHSLACVMKAATSAGSKRRQRLPILTTRRAPSSARARTVFASTLSSSATCSVVRSGLTA